MAKGTSVLREASLSFGMCSCSEKVPRLLGQPGVSLRKKKQMADLKGKTIFITGASRGIGKAIGLRAARDGANIVIAAKTTEPHPKLPGTIFTAAAEMEAAGGKALACAVDIRLEDQVREAVAKAIETFGGID